MDEVVRRHAWLRAVRRWQNMDDVTRGAWHQAFVSHVLEAVEQLQDAREDPEVPGSQNMTRDEWLHLVLVGLTEALNGHQLDDQGEPGEPSPATSPATSAETPPDDDEEPSPPPAPPPPATVAPRRSKAR